MPPPPPLNRLVMFFYFFSLNLCCVGVVNIDHPTHPIDTVDSGQNGGLSARKMRSHGRGFESTRERGGGGSAS